MTEPEFVDDEESHPVVAERESERRNVLESVGGHFDDDGGTSVRCEVDVFAVESSARDQTFTAGVCDDGFGEVLFVEVVSDGGGSTRISCEDESQI